MTALMTVLDRSNVPAYSVRVCRVEVLLDLLFGDGLKAESVGELSSAVTMYVLVIVVISQHVHRLTPADEVVDTIFDLLWHHQERRGGVVLGALEVRKSVKVRGVGSAYIA